MIAKNFVEKDFKDTLMYIYENKDNKEKLHEFLTKNLKNKAGKTLADDEKEVNKVISKISEVFDKYDIAPKVVKTWVKKWRETWAKHGRNPTAFPHVPSYPPKGQAVHSPFARASAAHRAGRGP